MKDQLSDDGVISKAEALTLLNGFIANTGLGISPLDASDINYIFGLYDIEEPEGIDMGELCAAVEDLLQIFYP